MGEERQEALQVEVERLKAQLESERINAEQSSQAIEERYRQLADEYASSCSARELADAEAKGLQKELAGLKSQNQKQSLRTMELEQEVERQKVEIRELHTDKRSVLRVVEQRGLELKEKNETIQGYLDRIVGAANAKAELESKLREVRADQGRHEAAQARLQQENDLLKQHNAWLDEELSAKSSVLLEDRRKTSDEVVSLRSRIAELEAEAGQGDKARQALETRGEDLETRVAGAESRVRELKQAAAAQESHFGKEISTAKRLIGLYKESSEKGKAKVTELEGIVQELRRHLAEAQDAQADALAKAEDKRKEAEEHCASYKDQLQRTLNAAAQGKVPPATGGAPATPGATLSLPAFPTAATPSTGASAGGAALQMLELSPAAAAATMLSEGLSLTEMYSKYVEVSDAWRQERSERKKLQAYLDAILGELERKAPLINEQKQEYERLMASHSALSGRLEDAIGERRSLEAQVGRLEADCRRRGREKGALEAQAEDLSRQVRVLLAEVEGMKAGRAVKVGEVAADEGESENGTVVAAGDVITSRLVEFRSLEELQEQNRRLLAVSRQLGEESEQRLGDLREELEREHGKKMSEVASDLEGLRAERDRSAGLMQQIVRQRDLYKSLLAEKEGTAQGADGTTAVGSGAGAPSAASVLASGAEHKAMYVELRKEFDKHKVETTENARLLREEASKYREDCGVARGEKAQIQAQLEFECERYDRLKQICDAQGKEVEQLAQKNTGLVQQVTEHQQRLQDMSFTLDVAKDDLRREMERVTALQAEKDLFGKSEKRLSDGLASAVAEKHRVQASLEAGLQRQREQEANFAKEKERLSQEAARLRGEWADAQKQLLAESARSRDAAVVSSGASASTAARIAALEVELKGLREFKEEAGRKLASASSKVDSLQQSLQKAEEKAALAVMRSQATASQPRKDTEEGGVAAGTESERVAEIKQQLQLAREEAGAAQEAAAAAAGHVAQYKAMSAASDEALEAMKAAHESFKRESARALEVTRKEVEAATEKLAEAEAEVNKKRGLDAEEEKQRMEREESLLKDCSQLREERAKLTKEIESTAERLQTLDKDVKDYHQQWRTAQGMYDSELISHAADVKRLNSLEQEHAQLQQTIQDSKSASDAMQVAARSAEAKLAAENSSLGAEMASLQSKMEELREQNRVLHEELERVAAKPFSLTGASGEAAPSGPQAAAEMQQVLSYLRKEKETSDCQLQLLQQENTRLRKQLEHALHGADEARARLEAESKRATQQAAAEEDHARLLDKVNQLHLIRESNAGLRAENEKLQAKAKELKVSLEEAQSSSEPLQSKLRQLQSVLSEKDEEVASIKKQSERWEQRTRQLLDKYGQVDIGEHERVCAALKDSEAKVASAAAAQEEALKQAAAVHDRAMGSTREDLAKAKRQEEIAKKQIFNVFNPSRLDIKQWIAQRDAREAKLEELERKLAEGISSSKSDLSAYKAELDGERARAEGLQEQLTTLKAKHLDTQHKALAKLKSAAASKKDNEAKIATLVEERDKLKGEAEGLVAKVQKQAQLLQKQAKQAKLTQKQAKQVKAQKRKSLEASEATDEVEEAVAVAAPTPPTRITPPRKAKASPMKKPAPSPTPKAAPMEVADEAEQEAPAPTKQPPKAAAVEPTAPEAADAAEATPAVEEAGESKQEGAPEPQWEAPVPEVAGEEDAPGEEAFAKPHGKKRAHLEAQAGSPAQKKARADADEGEADVAEEAGPAEEQEPASEPIIEAKAEEPTSEAEPPSAAAEDQATASAHSLMESIKRQALATLSAAAEPFAPKKSATGITTPPAVPAAERAEPEPEPASPAVGEAEVDVDAAGDTEDAAGTESAREEGEVEPGEVREEPGEVPAATQPGVKPKKKATIMWKGSTKGAQGGGAKQPAGPKGVIKKSAKLAKAAAAAAAAAVNTPGAKGKKKKKDALQGKGQPSKE